jgi:hypothetical protein
VSASATPRSSIATRGEESPISRRQHLRDPNGYTRRCSGATVGDGHKGPLNNQGKLTFFHKKQNANKPKTHLRQNSLPYGWAHGPGGSPSRRPNHPRAELRSARGAQHYTGELPPRSGVGRLLERGSASLEGRSLPWVRFHLARGAVPPSGEVPPRSRASWARRLRTCSPTGAFNVQTFAGT